MDSNDNDNNEQFWGSLLTPLKSLAKPLSGVDEAILGCPYCSKVTSIDSRFCAQCGRDIVPFIATMRYINEIQETLIKTKSNSLPASSVFSEKKPPSRGTCILLALRRFMYWNTLNRLLLFSLFSYLCLFGTALSEQSLGAYILIAATFGISLSLGKAHARQFPDSVDKSWIFSIFGALFGTLILLTQFSLQSLLTDNFVWPEGRTEAFETFNTILGVTFAYLTGAMLNNTLPAINNQLVSGRGMGSRLIQYRQALLPLTLFVVTVTPKIMNLF